MRSRNIEFVAKSYTTASQYLCWFLVFEFMQVFNTIKNTFYHLHLYKKADDHMSIYNRGFFAQRESAEYEPITT